MLKSKNTKKLKYDLEDRTYLFAAGCRDFIKTLIPNTANVEYSRQLIRSSGSQAANFIEATHSLSKKDFTHRIKICRKEAKESYLWLRLCDVVNDKSKIIKNKLLNESLELTKIFSSIMIKCTKR